MTLRRDCIFYKVKFVSLFICIEENVENLVSQNVIKTGD